MVSAETFAMMCDISGYYSFAPVSFSSITGTDCAILFHFPALSIFNSLCREESLFVFLYEITEAPTEAPTEAKNCTQVRVALLHNNKKKSKT